MGIVEPELRLWVNLCTGMVVLAVLFALGLFAYRLIFQ
jgi:hypothetical protein